MILSQAWVNCDFLAFLGGGVYSRRGVYFKIRDFRGRLFEAGRLFEEIRYILSIIKTTFEALCENKVVGMKDYKLIQSRRQPVNLKKILTKAEFSSKPPMVTKCRDKRCECCNHLLLLNHYVFKEVNYKFTLKSPMFCGGCNLIYVVLCFGCNGEYIHRRNGYKQAKAPWQSKSVQTTYSPATIPTVKSWGASQNLSEWPVQDISILINEVRR